MEKVREIKATFIYETRSILVSGSSTEETASLLLKFINKLNPASELCDYIFYYEGNIVDSDTIIGNYPLISDKNEITISVQKNLRIIKCPKCNYNDCVINLADYQVNFYGCEHKHSYSTTYNKYFRTQKMELSDIKCCVPNCPYNEQNNNLDFFLCLSCSKLLDRSKSYCNACDKFHDKEHERIKFDHKNYHCKQHFKQYMRYCFNCKKNLCEECVKEHAEHNHKSYEVMAPKKEELENLKNSLELMKKNINNLKLVVDDIIYSLYGSIKIFQSYYDIAKNIIDKYEKFNKGPKDYKNYTMLKTLRDLKKSNEKVMKDLNEIIYEKEMINKSEKILNIYQNKNSKYKGNINDNDFNNENDDDWIKEINENNQQTPPKNIIKEDPKKKKLKKNNINNH